MLLKLNADQNSTLQSEINLRLTHRANNLAMS